MIFPAVTTSDRKLDVNWDLVNRYVSKWRPGTRLRIEIKRKQKTVSDPLRRYYFSTVLPILMKATGYEPEEQMMVHEYLKAIYFQCEQDDRGIYRNIPSVFSNNSKVEIPQKAEFVEWVKRKAAENGEYCPDPGE